MLLRDHDDLEKMIRDAIKVDTRNWKTPELVKQVRQLLGKSDAVSPMNIRNYRFKGIPSTVKLGAAIAYCSMQDSEFIQSMSSEAELLVKAGQIYEKLTGLGISKVEYECKLLKSEKYPDRMDAEVTAYYRHPIVHKDFGSTILPIQIFTDLASLDDITYSIECFGPGLQDPKNLNSKVDIVERRSVTDGKLTSETKCEFIVNVKIDSNTDSTSYIKVSRKLLGAFRLNPTNPSDREYAGFKVTCPMRSMSLTLIFPEDLFPNPEKIPVTINAWGPGTVKMGEVDYVRTSSFLAPNAPMPKGKGIWNWQSSTPLMIGMAYALTYNIQAALLQLKGNVDARGEP